MSQVHVSLCVCACVCGGALPGYVCKPPCMSVCYRPEGVSVPLLCFYQLLCLLLAHLALICPACPDPICGSNSLDLSLAGVRHLDSKEGRPAPGPLDTCSEAPPGAPGRTSLPPSAVLGLLQQDSHHHPPTAAGRQHTLERSLSWPMSPPSSHFSALSFQFSNPAFTVVLHAPPLPSLMQLQPHLPSLTLGHTGGPSSPCHLLCLPPGRFFPQVSVTCSHISHRLGLDMTLCGPTESVTMGDPHVRPPLAPPGLFSQPSFRSRSYPLSVVFPHEDLMVSA